MSVGVALLGDPHQKSNSYVAQVLPASMSIRLELLGDLEHGLFSFIAPNYRAIYCSELPYSIILSKAYFLPLLGITK